MASSYQDRLKARRGGGVPLKKPKKLKLNATKKIRGKTVYWNPYTKSWSKTKVVKKAPKVEVKKETRAQKLEKEGFADLRGGKTKKKPSNNQSSNSQSNNNQQSQNQSSNNNKLKVKATTTGGPVKSGVEYARSKGDDLAGFRRQKDTRITKKLKKAGFTEDRLARLRKKNADFQKAKKGGKKAMEAYRKKYPKRG